MGSAAYHVRESAEPDQAVACFGGEITGPASTRLNFHSVELGSFHPDPRRGAPSGNGEGSEGRIPTKGVPSRPAAR